MKGRISLLGVLLVGLFAILLIKSDRAQETPAALEDFSADVPSTVVPFERSPEENVVRKPARKTKKSPRASGVQETQVPSSSEEPATAPAQLQIEVPPRETAPAGGSGRALPENGETENGVADRMPFPWMDQAQEAQPGFVDPNRLDARNPTGAPILQRPAPTGPGAGFYDPDNRFAEKDR